MKKNKPRYPNKYLILGVFIAIIGLLCLLGTLGFLPSFQALWPFPLIIVGLFFLYIVYFRHKSDIYIIFGMIFFLTGIFLLLINTIISITDLAKIWPGFMLIAGISLLPYAYKRKKLRQQIGIIIPALALILLALVFFLFSLNIASLSLSDFVSQWWPLLLVFLGASFIIVYFFSHKTPK